DSGEAGARPRRRRRSGARPESRASGDAGKEAAAAARALYQGLHRALLAGLPTQVGHALPERDRRRQVGYEGPRGRRFQLFPGSTLASRPPPWLLSATLLDTEKLWALTNAAIEPEWVEAELPHLLSRRHFDPRWSRRQGRVVGSEQVALFGLVLAAARPFHYGAHYPRRRGNCSCATGLSPARSTCARTSSPAT